MRLKSVRDLKAELLSGPKDLMESVAATATFSTFASPLTTAGRTLGGIALGVTLAKKEYRLAVRLQQSGPLVSEMAEKIRQRAKGEADVQFIGNLVKFPGVTQPAFYQDRRRPLRIGSSISDINPQFFTAGTLGCFVAQRSGDRFIGMLTNNHVIANENSNSIGMSVVQPGTLDDDGGPDPVVGELGKFERLRRRSRNFIDAAVGFVYEDIEFDTSRIGNLGRLAGQGDVEDLPDRATLHKVGRTTGQRKGRLTAFDVDNVQVEYDMGVLRFDNQIEIEGAGNRAFSASGDSGSLVVDDSLRAIGLLFAGGDEGGSNGKGLTYANPIGTVLDKLKMDLEI